MRLEVLIGIMASGKTGYARSKANKDTIIINYKMLFNMLYQGSQFYHEFHHPDFFNTIQEKIAVEAARHGKDVIVDGEHLSQHQRKKWVNFSTLIKQHHLIPIQLVAVVFPTKDPAIHAFQKYRIVGPSKKTFEEFFTEATKERQILHEETKDLIQEGFDQVKMMSTNITDEFITK